MDVREPWELEAARLSGTIDLPMSTLPKGLCHLDQEKSLVVLCHHGGRSAQVAAWLRKQGFAHAQSMAGGIEQWAIEIEPGMARY